MTWLAELLGLQAPQPRAQAPRSDFLAPNLDELLGADAGSVEERDFIAAMQQKQLAEASAARQQAAMLANMPQGTGQISNVAPSRAGAIGDMLFGGLEQLGMPKLLANDYAGYGQTAADMTLPGTLDQLDAGDFAGAAENLVGGPAAKGIRAFHGSPHSFDKFSLDKIGTGEGAANNGLGINLTDDEGEALTYRKPDIRDNPFQKSKFDGEGHAYEVNINASPEEFIDLDLPINQQPQAVQDAVRQWSSKVDMGDKRKLSFYLREGRGIEGQLEALGYKGLRAEMGRNTHHTVFDPAILDIVRKYGIPAALGAGLITEEMARQMQEQGLGQI